MSHSEENAADGGSSAGGADEGIGAGEALKAPICTSPHTFSITTTTTSSSSSHTPVTPTPPTIPSLLLNHINSSLLSSASSYLNHSHPSSVLPSSGDWTTYPSPSPSPSSSSPPSSSFDDSPFAFFSFSSSSSSPPPPRLCRAGDLCTTSDRPGATIVSPLLLSLTGITGHIWALCYLHGTSPRNAHRNVFHTLLLTLIWTDFLGKIATTVPAVTAYAVGSWVGGKPLCDYHGFSMVLVCLLTHFTVSAMAVERFLGICHGYFYGRHVTTTRCRYVLAGMWVFCSLFSLLPLFNLGQLFLQYPNTWCFANLHICHDTPARHRFFTTTLGLLTVANLLTVVVCNVMVVGTLLRMRVSRRVPASLGSQSRGKSDHELQMVVVLVLITVLFTISWAPLDFLIVSNPAWPPHAEDKDHVIELVAIRLVSLNQIADPWVYIVSRVAFRSRAWRWCRHGLVGRGWSHRWRSHNNNHHHHHQEEEGSLWSHHLSSLLHHTRKLSRPNAVPLQPPSPPPPAAAAAGGGPLDFTSPPLQLLQDCTGGEEGEEEGGRGGADPSTPLPHEKRSSYSGDSGKGGSYWWVETEGVCVGVLERSPHVCCLHPSPHLTRSQPLLPLPPTSPSPSPTHKLLTTTGDGGVLRSNSWGARRLPRPLHLLLQQQRAASTSPSHSHSRSTQTLPCPPTPPPPTTPPPPPHHHHHHNRPPRTQQQQQHSTDKAMRDK